MIKEGEEAPDFELSGSDGGLVKLSDYRGKWIVLHFVNKVFHPSGAFEAMSFNKLLGEFERMGIVVLGVSTDTVEVQRKFVEKYGIKFKLLSDHDENVCKAYGIKGIFGIVDVTFIISPEGKIVKAIRVPLPGATYQTGNTFNASRHPSHVLDYLKTVIKD